MRTLLLVIANVLGVVLCKQPNIVFILADDYGWNDIGYHDSNIKTPTLDKLAAGGIRLENHYVQPVCTPTRSALLSGRMPIHTGMHKKIHTSAPICHPLEDVFLPEKLRELGYATHMIGKWHVGFCKEQCTPVNRGFDSFFGFFSGEESYFTHMRDGFMDFSSQTSTTALKPEHNYTGIYSTHAFVQKAQDVIRSHKLSSPNKPLFLYLPFQSVHLPNQVPLQYEYQYRHFVDKPRKKYSAMVSCMDEAINNVTHTLKDTNMWDNTIIVFSADNGGQINWGASNWPLRGGKGSTFEGGIRVNAFVHSPLIKRSHVISYDLFHVTDWFPTLVEAGGGDTIAMEIDGISQWDMLRTGSPSRRREVLHDIDPTEAKFLSRSQSDIFDTRIRAAIRVGDWKLITGNTGTARWHIKPAAGKKEQWRGSERVSAKNLLLFNVTKDPSEEHDFSDAYPHIVESMLKRLQYYHATTRGVKWPEKDPRSKPTLTGGVWKPWITSDSDHLNKSDTTVAIHDGKLNNHHNKSVVNINLHTESKDITDVERDSKTTIQYEDLGRDRNDVSIVPHASLNHYDVGNDHSDFYVTVVVFSIVSLIIFVAMRFGKKVAKLVCIEVRS